MLFSNVLSFPHLNPFFGLTVPLFSGIIVSKVANAYLFIYLFTYLFIYLFIYLSIIYLFIYLFIYFVNFFCSKEYSIPYGNSANFG